MLAAIAEDVSRPWVGPTASTLAGRLTATRRRAAHALATPLDGSVRVTLRPPARSRVTLELLDPARGKVLERGTAVAPRPVTVRTTACGHRSLVARVTAAKGAGAYRLAVSLP